MEEKKSFSWVWWLITLILACGIVGFVVHNNSEKIDNFFHQEEIEECAVTDSTDIQQPELTIQEVLEFREHLRECQRIDSVFMAMPEVVLIDILMNHGTNLSNSDIVYIYEANPDTYNAVQSGARAQKYKEELEHKQIEPDTIPEKPAIDQPISLTF